MDSARVTDRQLAHDGVALDTRASTSHFGLCSAVSATHRNQREAPRPACAGSAWPLRPARPVAWAWQWSSSRPCCSTVIADAGLRRSPRLVGECHRPDHGHGGEALAAKRPGSAGKIRPINRSLSRIARESTRTASCPRSLSLFRARESQAADAMPSPSGQSAVHRRGVL
jgi:hypothetical protein